MADTVRGIREMLADYHCWHTFRLDCQGCDLLDRCKTETEKTLLEIRTLVLAEVNKIGVSHGRLGAYMCKKDVIKALTKLFEGGKEK